MKYNQDLLHSEPMVEKVIASFKEVRDGDVIVREITSEKQVTAGEEIAQSFKAAIPLLKGKARPDQIIILDIPTIHGLVHAVMRKSRKNWLPIEYMVKLKGKLPQAAALRSSRLWSTSDKKLFKKHPFCEYLATVGYERKKRSFFSRKSKPDEWEFHTIEWDADFKQELPNGNTIKLEWAIQLVPIDNDEYFLIYRYPTCGGGHQFIKAMEVIPQFIDEYEPKPETVKQEILYPAISFIALSYPKEPVAVYNEHDTNPSSVKSTINGVDLAPIDIAKQRLAKGEITVEEFKDIEDALR